MIGIGLWVYCFKKLFVGFISLVVLVVFVFSMIEGLVIFLEYINFWILVSFLIILWGMYLVILSKFIVNLGVEFFN